MSTERTLTIYKTILAPLIVLVVGGFILNKFVNNTSTNTYNKKAGEGISKKQTELNLTERIVLEPNKNLEVKMRNKNKKSIQDWWENKRN